MGRRIQLPGGGGQDMAPQGDADDVMANLEANVQIRDRSQLPQRVKVITPAVIRKIVHGIVDQFAGGADANQLAQLAADQTQLQLRLQQTQDKLAKYQTQYQQLHQAYQTAQQMVAEAQAGQGGGEMSAQIE